MEAVIEAYKKGIDRTMLREGLRRTVQERFDNLVEMQKFADELRRRPIEGSSKFGKLLSVLLENEVAFILVGESAGLVHGEQRFHSKIEIVYRRDRENTARLADALALLRPRLRGAADRLNWDILNRDSSVRLATNSGCIDLLGDICGVTYEKLLSKAIQLDAYGSRLRCLTGRAVAVPGV